MKKTNTALAILVFFIAAIIFSCKKDSAASPQLQPLIALEQQCDSLVAALASSNTTALSYKTSISSFTTNQPALKLSVDSAQTQLASLLTLLISLKSEVSGTYNNISAITKSKSISTGLFTQQRTQVSQLNTRYISLAAQLQQAENQIEEIVVPRSYIKLATRDHQRNDQGDVIPVPGRYLAAYIRYNMVNNDIGPSTLVGKFSTDTTGQTWGNEFVISPNIGKINVMCPSLLRVDANTIDCYFMVKNSTADTRLFLTVSHDNGVSWSAAQQIIYEHAYDIFNNAVMHTVNNGRLVLPIAHVPVFTKGFTFSDYCLYSDDGGNTWKKSSSITPAVTDGGLEPEVTQLSGDTCLMNIRTETGYQYFSISTDNCATWGPPYQSTLVNPFADAEIVNVSGKLIAIHNYTSVITQRNPLSISISLDKGATWRHLKDIESGNPSLYGWSYPSVRISNGYLLISYYETVNEPDGDQLYNLKFTKIELSTLF